MKPVSFKVILLVAFFQLQASSNAQSLIENGTHVNTAKSVNYENNNSSGAGLIFGIPAIPIDRAIPGLRDDDDLENWVAPDEFRKRFPNYLSGFDRKNHPIWICEWGKYDMHYVLNGGKEKIDIFEKYQRQAAYVAKKSQLIKSTKEKPVNHHVVIIDFEGLRADLVSDPRVIEYMVRISRKYRQFFEKNIIKYIAINVNFVAEIVINLARPIFGRVLRRFEVYGTNRAKFIPSLLKSLPQDQLPGWLGGDNNHKPVYVHG